MTNKVRKQKITKPFPTQERLHSILDRHYDDQGKLYFISKIDRWKVKKGDVVKGYDTLCNKGFPSAHKRTFLGIDGHVQQIAVWAYVYEYGDYDRVKYTIDHIDGDHANNNHSNLRLLTRQQQSMNRRGSGSSKSGMKGVAFHNQTNKYHATIRFNYISHSLGLFDDPIDAGKAYDAAAYEMCGSVALLNFPENYPK